MVESQNREGAVKTIARIVGLPNGSLCNGLSHAEAAKKTIQEELQRDAGKRGKKWIKSLKQSQCNSFLAEVEVQDFFDGNGLHLEPAGPPCIVKVTVSLKFEFSTRQPGANE